ncbi:30S ribosomal protein S20 [Aerococcaceae bacterium DSM 111176]|nr:30S ribosomal protein S20 [Aerococcaceae bacterium DSM 111176]
MANSAQATKRVRQNASKEERNTAQLSAMRTAVKQFNQAIETGEGDKQALFNHAAKLVDRAAGKGLVHKNKARNVKVAMTESLNA